MDGRTIARIVDSELASRGISKADFYAQSGVSSATLSQWRTGKYDPTPDKIAKIEKCLGISLSDYEKSDRDSETDEVLQWLREDFSHRAADDVDTDNGIIHVRGASVIGLNNKLTDKNTNKNTTSARDVHIAIPRLTELICGKNGKLITTNPTTLYALINRLCKKHGLPEVGVHGLRHSYISLCFHLGWDMKTVMREGGYSNTQTVNEVYRHLAAQDANDDIKRMKDFYS